MAIRKSFADTIPQKTKRGKKKKAVEKEVKGEIEMSEEMKKRMAEFTKGNKELTEHLFTNAPNAINRLMATLSTQLPLDDEFYYVLTKYLKQAIQDVKAGKWQGKLNERYEAKQC